MSKREDLGKPIVKIYGRAKDLVLCLVCIALAVVLKVFADYSRKPLYGNSGTEFFIYCGVAIIFLIFAFYYLYQFCHVLVLCENGFKFFTPIGKKSYRYDECQFETKYVFYIPFFNSAYLLASRGTVIFWPGSDPIIVEVLIITAQIGKKRVAASGKHLGHFIKKMRKFVISRKEIGLPDIEYSVKRFRKFPSFFEDWLYRTWEWDN